MRLYQHLKAAAVVISQELHITGLPKDSERWQDLSTLLRGSNVQHISSQKLISWVFDDQPLVQASVATLGSRLPDWGVHSVVNDLKKEQTLYQILGTDPTLSTQT